MKFTKLPVISQSAINDTIMHVRVDQITDVAEATPNHKSHREEIVSIVTTQNGQGIGTSRTVDDILAELAEIELPS